MTTVKDPLFPGGHRSIPSTSLLPAFLAWASVADPSALLQDSSGMPLVAPYAMEPGSDLLPKPDAKDLLGAFGGGISGGGTPPAALPSVSINYASPASSASSRSTSTSQQSGGYGSAAPAPLPPPPPPNYLPNSYAAGNFLGDRNSVPVIYTGDYTSRMGGTVNPMGGGGGYVNPLGFSSSMNVRPW